MRVVASWLHVYLLNVAYHFTNRILVHYFTDLLYWSCVLSCCFTDSVGVGSRIDQLSLRLSRSHDRKGKTFYDYWQGQSHKIILAISLWIYCVPQITFNGHSTTKSRGTHLLHHHWHCRNKTSAISSLSFSN